MDAPNHVHPDQSDHIWRRNASMIRQLYQEEKKTLKEVKSIMEKDKGFPVTPLSVWEVRLRQLGMQKHLKAAQWGLIYQHVRPRLQHQGKKKLAKPTAILINGTKKPWDDVWKEFRRNKALFQRPHQGPLPALPPGVIVRTPSPELLGNHMQMQQSQLFESFIFHVFHGTLESLQPLFGLAAQVDGETRDALKYPDSVYRLCLSGIPFSRLLEQMSSSSVPGDILHPLIVGGTPSIRIPQPLRHSNNHTASRHSPSWKPQLTGFAENVPTWQGLANPAGQELGRNFDSHLYLLTVIYLLSNDHLTLGSGFNYELGLERILEMAFKFTSRNVLLALLESGLLSIKAAWEQLLLGAGNFKDRGAFRDLIRVGMKNNWLEEALRGHEHLYHAIQNGSEDLVDSLLARGCRADSACGMLQRRTAVMAALENGDLDCAKVLIQHVDVNREFRFELWMAQRSTNFVEFIVKFNCDRTDHQRCLDYFLEQGADVDYELDDSTVLQASAGFGSTMNAQQLVRAWPFSILDFVYHFRRPAYPKLVKFSKKPQIFSRSRALWCLEEGVHMLQEYLLDSQDFALSKPREPFGEETAADHFVSFLENRHLEALLFEQFLLGFYRSKRKVCYTTVQSLLELGADLRAFSTRADLAADMLCATAWLISSEDKGETERGMQLMQTLLDRGFQVQEDALETAFAASSNTLEKYGLRILECLTHYCSDLDKYGGNAVAEAIFRGNLDATRLLLDGGMDPNSIVHYRGSEASLFAIAAGALVSPLATMKYLIQRGSDPRICKEGEQPIDVLVGVLLYGFCELFQTVRYMIEEHITITEPSIPSAYLLEICVDASSELEERREIFEYLLGKGAKLSPGSPLAEWIASGGGHDLVQQMLDAGADPDAYSYDICHRVQQFSRYPVRRTPLQAAAGVGDYVLACLLLELGADLNRPALGRCDKTALQAVCAWNPVDSEGRARKDKIVKLLLDKGADPNATNYSTGQTALIFAAAIGDLSTAFTLLKYGARVDLIWADASGIRDDSRTALDVAAEHGRLDMVEFLLNANAMSSSSCSDGKHYDGAIRLAREAGHFVVAELICKHSADRERDWAVVHEHTADRPIHRSREAQAPSFDDNSQMADHQLEKSCTHGAKVHNATCILGQEQGCCDAVSEAKEKSAAEPVMTGGSRVLATEDVEDELLVTDFGDEEAPRRARDRTTDQKLGGCEASSETAGRLGRLEGQVWDIGVGQNGIRLIPEIVVTIRYF